MDFFSQNEEILSSLLSAGSLNQVARKVLTGAGAGLIVGAIIGYGLGSASSGIGPSGGEAALTCGILSGLLGAVLAAIDGRVKSKEVNP